MISEQECKNLNNMLKAFYEARILECVWLVTKCCSFKLYDGSGEEISSPTVQNLIEHWRMNTSNRAMKQMAWMMYYAHGDSYKIVAGEKMIARAERKLREAHGEMMDQAAALGWEQKIWMVNYFNWRRQNVLRCGEKSGNGWGVKLKAPTEYNGPRPGRTGKYCYLHKFTVDENGSVTGWDWVLVSW